MSHKVVYNADWGGYHIPKQVLKRYNELAGTNYNDYYEFTDELPRHDPYLVQAFEELIAEDPLITDCAIWELKGNKYIIREYDGLETVYEPDEIEWITI